jgi:hypothetical protein
MIMLPPPTRMTCASPCFVLTWSIASSRAREISRSPEVLMEGETSSSVNAFDSTRSVAYRDSVSTDFVSRIIRAVALMKSDHAKSS